GRMSMDASGLAAAEGRLWAIRNAGQAEDWTGSDWNEVPTAVAGDGSRWFLGASNVDGRGDHSIYMWSAGTLTKLPGVATNVVWAGGTVWSLTAGGQVSSWDGTAWVKQTNGTQLLAAFGGLPYVVSTAGAVS